MKVQDILNVKGTHVISVHQEKTVYEAMQTFAKNKVGSLLVLDDNGIAVGIIAARDVLMETLKSCEEIKSTKVKDIMTKEIIVASPEDSIEEVEKLMTVNRIRHVPIVKEREIAGLISIGDVVKAQLRDLHVENRYLKDYVSGKYPA